MAKLKLKSVQNGIKGDNVDLMNIYYEHFDESGNWIDESGNIIEGGTIYIEGGSGDFLIGMLPKFKIPVAWDSGSIDLPLTIGSINPCVSVEFGNAILVETFGDYSYLHGPTDLTTRWISPFDESILFPFTLENGDGQMYSSHVTGTFHVPYVFIPPVNNDDNK